ncbi:hypothetical protein MLD38_026987 [Melastoma candidum]|uniref:Uncharacterized protein n=1 Tax=Melastoma candidum TaxID=119954 RepID=A0ACB9P3G3_9MYRT|nr:hypothetical protein MLD38_026987 [Melastoma candidum]
MAAVDATKDLLSSVVSDIKSYMGDDPILPWLRGMKRMKDDLEPQLLKEKLPRFLQRCTQKFAADRRYRNDLRYLHVWIHLMDYVDDPGLVLEKMERNKIGMKWSLFYQAYALYYEKNKKFAEAEKMYHLGVQNLAEPMDELKKSYEMFLLRMDRHKAKRIQHQKGKSSSRTRNSDDCLKSSGTLKACREQKDAIKIQNKSCDVETGEVSIEKPRVENTTDRVPRDPKVITKEAQDGTESKSLEPLEMFLASARSQRGYQNETKSSGDRFEVSGGQQMNQNNEELESHKIFSSQPEEEGFDIYIDCEESAEQGDNPELNQSLKSCESMSSTSSNVSAFVFPIPKDLSSENSGDLGGASSIRGKFREDTVVHKFVGKTVLDDEPVVENVCHHGLVEPTVNLKQAMDEINNMFGKPMDFVRKRRSKKQDEGQVSIRDDGAFMILADDDFEDQPVLVSSSEEKVLDVGFSILPDHEEDHKVLAQPHSSAKSRECDLYEPTVFTKEAMDDINKMFGMPLDF